MKKPTANKDTYQYQSFLVRLWQDDEEAPWRVSAQHVATGKQQFFNSLESLFVYLQAQTETAIDRHNPLFQNLLDE